MADDLKMRALELANSHAGEAANQVVERASHYHAFLSGTTAAAKPAAPAGKPAAPAAAAKPAAPAGNKPAAAAAPAAAKPPAAAAKPAAAKPAAAKVSSKHTIDEVRNIIRQVSTTEGLGKQSALDLLDEEAGSKNVTDLKADAYDKVYEACVVALQGVGVNVGGEEATTEDEFDPTA